MNEFEEILDEMMTETGFNNPVIVNEIEKNEFQKELDDLKSQELNKNPYVPVTYEDMSWGQTISTSLSNIPPTTLPFFEEYIKGIWHAIRHPIATAGELKDLAAGMGKTSIELYGLERYGRAEENRELIQQKLGELSSDSDVQKYLAWDDEMYNNFGTEENLKRHIAENPWEAITTLAELLIPTQKLLKLPKLTAARRLEPVNLTASAVGVPFKPLRKAPSSLHARALSLSESIPEKKRQRILSISQNNKLSMKLKSVNKVQQQLDEIDKLRIETIKTAGAKGVRVPMKNLFKKLDEYEKNMLATSGEGVAISPIIKNIKKNLMEAEEKLGRKGMTPYELQLRKERLGKELHKMYEKLAVTSEALPLKQEVKEIINRTVRETLQEIVPDTRLLKYPKLSRKILEKEFGATRRTRLKGRIQDITKGKVKFEGKVDKISLKQINEIEASLIELRKVIKSESYKTSIGELWSWQLGQKAATGTYIGGLTGGTISQIMGGDWFEGAKIGGGIGGSAGFIIGSIDSNSRLKMATGNYLNTLKKAGLVVSPNAAMIRLGLYEAGDYARNIPEGY